MNSIWVYIIAVLLCGWIAGITFVLAGMVWEDVTKWRSRRPTAASKPLQSPVKVDFVVNWSDRLFDGRRIEFVAIDVVGVIRIEVPRPTAAVQLANWPRGAMAEISGLDANHRFLTHLLWGDDATQGGAG